MPNAFSLQWIQASIKTINDIYILYYWYSTHIYIYIYAVWKRQIWHIYIYKCLYTHYISTTQRNDGIHTHRHKQHNQIIAGTNITNLPYIPFISFQTCHQKLHCNFPSRSILCFPTVFRPKWRKATFPSRKEIPTFSVSSVVFHGQNINSESSKKVGQPAAWSLDKDTPTGVVGHISTFM